LLSHPLPGINLKPISLQAAESLGVADSSLSKKKFPSFYGTWRFAAAFTRVPPVAIP